MLATPALVARARQMHENGMSYCDIGKALGQKKSTVYHWLTRNKGPRDDPAAYAVTLPPRANRRIRFRDAPESLRERPLGRLPRSPDVQTSFSCSLTW
jgi:IS30 family transposase